MRERPPPGVHDPDWELEQKLEARGTDRGIVLIPVAVLVVLGGIGWCVYEVGFDAGRARDAEEYLDGKICFPTRQPEAMP